VTKQLVCEGACNRGDVQAFDAAVKAAGRLSARNEQSVSNLAVYWLERGRKLLHTKHRALVMKPGARQAFACEDCACVRLW
jgi:hypothetical protein